MYTFIKIMEGKNDKVKIFIEKMKERHKQEKKIAKLLEQYIKKKEKNKH